MIKLESKTGGALARSVGCRARLLSLTSFMIRLSLELRGTSFTTLRAITRIKLTSLPSLKILGTMIIFDRDAIDQGALVMNILYTYYNFTLLTNKP